MILLFKKKVAFNKMNQLSFFNYFQLTLNVLLSWSLFSFQFKKLILINKLIN